MSVTVLHTAIVCVIGTNKASLNQKPHTQTRTDTCECGLPTDRLSRPINIHRSKQTMRRRAPRKTEGNWKTETRGRLEKKQKLRKGEYT